MRNSKIALESWSNDCKTPINHCWFAVYKRDDEKKHKLKQKNKDNKDEFASMKGQEQTTATESPFLRKEDKTKGHGLLIKLLQ